MASVNVAIIGAGSAVFSTRVVMDLALTPGISGSSVKLMDVDEHRLDMIYQLATRAVGELESNLRIEKTVNRDEALEGADFVINTSLNGGHAWHEAQRDMFEKHGYYRGAGNLNGDASLAGMGNMLLMLDIARSVERICPNAWLIQSSNPVFEGCTFVSRETDAKIIGLCHGHFGYKKVATELGLNLEHVSARMPGFNHWIFMTEFRYKGEDAYPLLDEWIEAKAVEYWKNSNSVFSEVQLSRASIHQYKLYGSMPIGDSPRFVGWWYQTDLETRKRWYNEFGGFDSEVGWAEYLINNANNIERIEQVARDTGRRVTDEFEPRLSDEQIVAIINSIANDIPGTYQVNIPNHGPLIPGFPEDLVVEVQAVADAGGVHGMAEPVFPSKLMIGAMIPRWHKAETMIESLRTRDRELLLQYLLIEPRTNSLDQATNLLEDWLSDPRNVEVSDRFSQNRRGSL